MKAGRPLPSTFKHQAIVLLTRLLSHVARMVPLRVSYWFADRAGDLVFLSFPTYRQSVRSNVSHVLGAKASQREVNRIARGIFQTSARNFVDVLRLPHLTSEDLRASVEVLPESRALLDTVVAEGRGAIIVTAHFGPFDYVGQILWHNGYNVVLLVARTVPESIYTAVTHLRGSHGGRFEPVTPGGIRRVMMELKRGGLVGLVADRDFFQSGRPVTFFGAETTLPPGPARFARESGAPIVALIAERRRHGYRMTVEPPFYVAKSDDEDRDIREALERIVAIFERHIRANPEQWVMFQRVWQGRTVPALRVFPVGSPLQGKILGHGADNTAPLTEPAEAADETGATDDRSATAAGDAAASSRCVPDEPTHAYETRQRW